ncbi:peptidase S8/S53 domain-containing protein [Syncephalis fuscata]|nr:peptidase S8/S53 domain-containing protein [Syncephalis fuscata]
MKRGSTETLATFLYWLNQQGILFNLRSLYGENINAISLEIGSGYIEYIRKNQQVEIFSAGVLITQALHGTHRQIELSHIPPTPHSVTGKNVKIGIIDSGVDYNHIALGGGFGQGYKIAHGYDFVGDHFNGKNRPYSSEKPLDTCNGHGTAVAGIMAASHPLISGVAPNATYGVYRIFGCTGTSSSDMALAALERAAEYDHMQIINLSYTGFYLPPNDPMIAYIEHISRMGVIIVAAAGNNFSNEMWNELAPSYSPSVLSVAVADAALTYRHWFLARVNGPHRIAYTPRCPANNYLTATVTVLSQTNECRIFGDIKGKVLLAESHNCRLDSLARAAKRLGAYGVIRQIPFTKSGVKENSDCKLPVYDISYSDMLKITRFINLCAEVKATFNHQMNWLPNNLGTHVDDTSMWGPTPRLTMNPDITAPGMKVITTMPQNIASFVYSSGSSMAAAYAAEHKNRGKNTNNDDLIANLKHYASWIGAKQTTGLASVAQQGVGMINVKNALLGTTDVQPAVLELGDHKESVWQKKVTITITNHSNSVQRYILDHYPAANVRSILPDGTPIKPPEHRHSPAAVVFLKNSFFLLAGQSKTVEITITAPSDLNFNESWVYSGFIQVRGIDVNSKSIIEHIASVPYFGLKGNIEDTRRTLLAMSFMNKRVVYWHD